MEIIVCIVIIALIGQWMFDLGDARKKRKAEARAAREARRTSSKWSFGIVFMMTATGLVILAIILGIAKEDEFRRAATNVQKENAASEIDQTASLNDAITDEYDDPYFAYESPPVAQSGGGDVFVHGYERSDGTQVPDHYRSAPNDTTYDNWSRPGNVNPYTGEIGTR